MKIGLVGCGYWGKIILNNLFDLGYTNITICEVGPLKLNLGRKIRVIKDYKKLKCDKVFVLTPAAHHFEICKHFLEQGTDVFCEKPLTLCTQESAELYHLAKRNHAELFVDWIFTFNKEINYIKYLYDQGVLGKIKHVNMSRQNFGPPRYDVDARWDLAAHDVSILVHLFGEAIEHVTWNAYKRDPQSITNDSCLGHLQFEDFTASINCSWAYSKKDRHCFFDFEKGYIEWDDATKQLDIHLDNPEKLLPYPSDSLESSPLHRSINTFLQRSQTFNFKEQQRLTLHTTHILQQVNQNND